MKRQKLALFKLKLYICSRCQSNLINVRFIQDKVGHAVRHGRQMRELVFNLLMD